MVIEPITVEVTIQNPLQIPVQIYSCQLLCDHYEIHEELSPQGVPADITPPEGSFTTEKLDFLLAGSETRTVSTQHWPIPV